MNDETIRQILKDDLKYPEKEDFNTAIIEKLKVKSRKQRLIVFNEKSIMYWFIISSCFVLFFYLQIGSQPSSIAILVGSMVCAMPIYLLIFNKIYSLKN